MSKREKKNVLMQINSESQMSLCSTRIVYIETFGKNLTRLVACLKSYYSSLK